MEPPHSVVIFPLSVTLCTEPARPHTSVPGVVDELVFARTPLMSAHRVACDVHALLLLPPVPQKYPATVVVAGGLAEAVVWSTRIRLDGRPDVLMSRKCVWYGLAAERPVTALVCTPAAETAMVLWCTAPAPDM
jgi:hypothetical protein